jgi:hypothetical protein
MHTFTSMRLLLSVGLLFLFQLGWSQFRERPQLIKYEIPAMLIDKPSTISFLGMRSDPPQTFKTQSPVLSSIHNLNDNQRLSWISSVTTQSYGNGKFGTYYYWDVQGNLQGTRGFIDIAGKNKRGWKLVFPWR